MNHSNSLHVLRSAVGARPSSVAPTAQRTKDSDIAREAPPRSGSGDIMAFEDRVSRLRGLERHRAVVVVLCAAAVALLLALHYTSTLHRLGVHDVLRRLFYLPVIVAAIAAGRRGGIGIAALAVLGFLPHLRQLAAADDRVMDSAVELLLLLVVGGLVGAFSDAGRRARALAAERGRIAALGETALALMAQTEGPLVAIEGQAESLHALTDATTSGAVPFAANAIRHEVARARQLIADIGQVASVSERRVERVELVPLLERIVGDATNARHDARCAVLVDEPRSCVIHSDRRAVAFSLRTLVFGLLDSVPAPGWLELRLTAPPQTPPTIEIGVFSNGKALPDLEQSLTRVFGAEAREYRFQQVLCIRVLASLGASVRYQCVSPFHSRVLLAFETHTAGVRQS